MPSLIDVVNVLAEAFDRLHVRYAVGGAIANNYWGIVRTTQDVDCLISLPALKYQLFADELQAIGCTLFDKDDKPVEISVLRLREQVQHRKLIECRYQSIRIELFVPAVPLQDEILRRAVPIQLGSRKIFVTTAEDLILLKLAFHRVKDLLDVRGILWVRRGQLDLGYLKLWSARMLEPQVQVELGQLIDEYAGTNTTGS
jgi:hypothetical protein